MSSFFKDLKVIELSSVLAGPSAGMFFAELGAQVLKVENKKTGGDVTRTWWLPEEETKGVSAYYCSVNYGKTVLMADLTDPADRALLMKHIAYADVVLSNYQPHTAAKLGMDTDSLRKANTRLIYAQLNGFHESDRPAFDVVLQAETGWISMTGVSADQPAKLPVALIDIIAGHQMKEAVLLALIHRLRTGEGSHVECNLEQASLSALANQATNYLMAHHVAQPIGTLHPNIAPYGDWFTARCGTRLVLAIGSDAQFAAFCESIGLPTLAAAADYSTNAQRVKNRLALKEALREAIAGRSFMEWQVKWDGLNIPYGEIKTIDKVMESAAAISMLRTEDREGKPTIRLSGNAFSASFLQHS